MRASIDVKAHGAIGGKGHGHLIWHGLAVDEVQIRGVRARHIAGIHGDESTHRAGTGLHGGHVHHHRRGARRHRIAGDL